MAQLNWPHVAMAVVLAGAILLAYAFAPPAAAATVSLTSMLAGAIFLNLKKGGGDGDKGGTS